jgi:rod shape-determining protein MreC
MAGSGWKWARGRGAKQLPLILCLFIAVATAVVGRAQASIFDNARAALSDWTAPALSGLKAPLTAVQDWIAGFGSMFTVYNENTELKRENAELQKWQQVALSLEDRLRSYQQLLNAVPDEKTPFITARVIGESSRPFVKTMILDAGSTQQVAKGQAVVNERGLLGRIYVTGQNTSWVILLTDLNSRVPVVIEPSHRRAILFGDNTPSPQLELDVGDGPVQSGDRVVTTGDGGLLPPDVPVGLVSGNSESARVALFASPSNADAVNILDYRIPDLPQMAEPLPTATGQKTASAKPATVVTPPAPPVPRITPRAPDTAEIPEELDR